MRGVSRVTTSWRAVWCGFDPRSLHDEDCYASILSSSSTLHSRHYFSITCQVSSVVCPPAPVQSGPADECRSFRLGPGQFLNPELLQFPLVLLQRLVHKRGVKVTVVLDRSQRTAKYSSATFLRNVGIPTFIDDKHAIAQNKIMALLIAASYGLCLA